MVPCASCAFGSRCPEENSTYAEISGGRPSHGICRRTRVESGVLPENRHIVWGPRVFPEHFWPLLHMSHREVASYWPRSCLLQQLATVTWCLPQRIHTRFRFHKLWCSKSMVFLGRRSVFSSSNVTFWIDYLLHVQVFRFYRLLLSESTIFSACKCFGFISCFFLNRLSSSCASVSVFRLLLSESIIFSLCKCFVFIDCCFLNWLSSRYASVLCLSIVAFWIDGGDLWLVSSWRKAQFRSFVLRISNFILGAIYVE